MFFFTAEPANEKIAKKSARSPYLKEHAKQISSRKLKNCSRGTQEKMPFLYKLLSGVRILWVSTVLLDITIENEHYTE